MTLGSGARAGRLLASLRLRLGLLISLTAIPAFAGVIAHMHGQELRHAEQEAYEDSERVVSLVALEHQRAMEGARRVVGSLAALDAVQRRDVAACARVLEGLRPAMPAYLRLAVADTRGDVFCSTAERAGPVNVADRPYFTRALSERGFVVGDFVVSRVSGRAVLSSALPALDRTGDPRAVVIAGVDLGWLQARAAELPMRKGSRIVVVDSQGTVLVRHPDPEEWAGKSLKDVAVVRAALASAGPGRLRAHGPDGVDRFFAFQPVGGPDEAGGAVALAGIPTSVALAPARAALWASLPFLAVAAVVALGAAWLGGERLIVRPARALAAAAVRMGQGDLGARTGLPHDGGTMGRLARAFDEMAESLAERTAQLGRQAALEQALGEAERASRARSEFLARMSHELRTPLNAILGFGQLLEMSVKEREDRESVEQVVRAGRHLLALVDEVLDLGRAETGRLALSLEPVEVGEAVAATLALVAPLAAERRSRCRAGSLPPSGTHVRADNQRLRQVLLNLVVNGIKHNVEGGSVGVGCERLEGGWLRIAVTDDGPGIAPELQSRLFAPFDRLGAEGRGTEGTGLGLALSRRLVEAMGGRIGVRSQPGQGSTFWVELPETEGPAERQAALEAREGEPAVAGAPRATVLYIEDNLANLRLMERVLGRRPGIRLVSAMQGRLGLDLAREHLPELILLDQHLPDLDGIEVLRRLGADPALRGTPVIVLSADLTPGEGERMRAAGARAFLDKPLDVKHLLALVDEILTVEDRAR